MSMASHALPWTSEQREWLQALGHDVLALAPVGSEADAVAAPGEAHRDPRDLVPRRVSSAPTSAAAPPLLRALARAAARDVDDAELLGIVADLSVLRGNPSARRALWPLLRALRKRTPR